MKLQTAILIFTIFLFSANSGKSQNKFDDLPTIPLKNGNSVLFGKDIIINNQPLQDQKNISVCSAFNGWLYAAYIYNDSLAPKISILKSTDMGISWTEVYNDYIDLTLGWKIERICLLVKGNTISDLRLFLGHLHHDTLNSIGITAVTRYNCEPFGNAQLVYIASSHTHDFALESDYMYPANGSNPYSIAILFSGYSNTTDTLIFVASNDGGNTFPAKRVLKISHNKHFDKVSLAYGYSPSKNTGRYFAAWEEKDNISSTSGHIYTAHSEPNFNSPFTTPICLDSLDPSAINKCRNPVIACQFDDSDNDSANLTEMVLYEKFIPAENRYDISGFYNLQATSTGYFRPISVSSTTNNKLQPDLQYNPFDSNFMLTYYDSTGQNLPFLTNNRNLVNPDGWNTLSQGYNDSPNLSSPHPKIELNLTEFQGMNVWGGQGTGNNSVAMFDAQYSTYTFVPSRGSSDITTLDLYPNPCSSFCNIEFDLNIPSPINVRLVNTLGRVRLYKFNQMYGKGHHVIRIDLKDIQPGAYVLSFKSAGNESIAKVVILK